LNLPQRGFWADRTVFLTGHTGFKGSWMTALLHRLGAKVVGFSLETPVSAPALFEVAGLAERCNDVRGDIRDLPALSRAIEQSNADILLHMAAQPIVREGVRDPLSTLDVNIMGTAKVLDAARRAPSLKTVLIVTSDKCYDNREQVWGYRENDAMGGSDPYSASKGCAELVSASFAKTYFANSDVRVASVRAGNVIGGGDWAADRLIPDLVKAAIGGTAVDIRSPDAVRPWQHVVDPLIGYLLAAQAVHEGRSARPFDAWNFGPNLGEELNVRGVVEAFQQSWGGAPEVIFGTESSKEAGLLRVDNTKAKVELGWRPLSTNEDAVASAAEWYRAFAEGGDPGALVDRHLDTVLSF
jgi:CDP-glucose 4,6-dehydratase